jgi:hypothetical protein
MKPPTRRDRKRCLRNVHNTHLSDYVLCTARYDTLRYNSRRLRASPLSLFHAKWTNRIHQSASSMSLNESNYVYKGGDTMVQGKDLDTSWPQNSCRKNLYAEQFTTQILWHTLVLRWVDKQSSVLPAYNYCYLRITFSPPTNRSFTMPTPYIYIYIFDVQ